ncbi:alpha-L-fucosidase [Tropicimonas marinistellae]|uniref:alpha-L-fucosidase n=1 Tax=Tropicimonas marinistellae TaxID=1739787 RepID=UPI00082FFE7B|nr:alpha-L-fucosidase [Tropicimonas marinistellae]
MGEKLPSIMGPTNAIVIGANSSKDFRIPVYTVPPDPFTPGVPNTDLEGWFKVDLEEGKTYQIDVRTEGKKPYKGLPDPMIELRKISGDLFDTGTKLLADKDSGSGNNAALFFHNDLKTGTYYLRVANEIPRPGRFNIQIRELDVAPGPEDDKHKTQSLKAPGVLHSDGWEGLLEFGQVSALRKMLKPHSGQTTSTKSSIDYEGDVDTFQVKLQAGATYHFTVNAPKSGPTKAVGVAAGDWVPEITVRSPSGVVVASDDNDDWDNVATASFRALETGTYKVDVEGSLPSSFSEDTRFSRLAAGAYVVSASGPLVISDVRGEDLIRGADVSEILKGLGGADKIDGGAGADVILGGDGTDTLRGGAGADWIEGGNHNDVINGNDGKDTLYGNRGSDVIKGDAGADTVFAGADDDTVKGGSEDDWLNGQWGNDTLYGDRGNDVIIGESGKDTVFAGAGSDYASGGDGDDWLNGQWDDDVLDGDAGNDVIIGESGNDTLDGKQDNDYLDGGDGSDLLRGGSGKDELHGGGGADTLYGNGGADTIDGGTGADTVFGGVDNDFVNGGADDDWLNGQWGNDTIYGNKGKDVIIGEDGDDAVFGGAEADYVTGGKGNDWLNGQWGHDTIYGNQGADLVLGEDGNDTVYGGLGSDYISGGDGDDWLNGQWGHDILDGDAGDDVLIGEDGNDLLDGKRGNDFLDGGNGNDTLRGGAGDDWLVGGAGSDLFEFALKHEDAGKVSTNTIADFQVGADGIVEKGPLEFSKILERDVDGDGDLDTELTTSTGRTVVHLLDVKSASLEDLIAESRMDWFADAELGMFVHWGIYSVLGGVWKGEQIYQGDGVNPSGEWILRDAQMEESEYAESARYFGLNPAYNPRLPDEPLTLFDADAWMREASEAGMEYFVITSKHHDGFCLWDSKVTDPTSGSEYAYDISATLWADQLGESPDPLGELKTAADKYGVKFGIYYSIWDWHNPAYDATGIKRAEDYVGAKDQDAYIGFMEQQLSELIALYDPDYIFMDGQWDIGADGFGWNYELGNALYDHIRDESPDVVVNNRFEHDNNMNPGNRALIEDPTAHNAAGPPIGDHFTLEQKEALLVTVTDTGKVEIDPSPVESLDPLAPYWMATVTMNQNWGYSANDDAWKDADELFDFAELVQDRGGTLLLNVGPDRAGAIPEQSIEILDYFEDMAHADMLVF